MNYSRLKMSYLYDIRKRRGLRIGSFPIKKEDLVSLIGKDNERMGLDERQQQEEYDDVSRKRKEKSERKDRFWLRSVRPKPKEDEVKWFTDWEKEHDLRVKRIKDSSDVKEKRIKRKEEFARFFRDAGCVVRFFG